jgi:hypothetical protein
MMALDLSVSDPPNCGVIDDTFYIYSTAVTYNRQNIFIVQGTQVMFIILKPL